MHTRFVEEPRGRLFAMEEKWKLIYNENQRSPTYSVSHYIAYLRRYVSSTGQLREVISGKTTERFSRKGLYDRAETRPTSKDTQRSLDSISPMSYFIRKLKLDLKMAFTGFVEEFVQAPNNGLRLLLLLLKNMQVLSVSSGEGVLARDGPKGTLKMEEYKKHMRSIEEFIDYNAGLLTVTSCVLSNFSRSRITALEILTLLLAGPSAVDRVLDAFTSMRIVYAESCRFKMLVNMLYTRGVSHVLFQVSCLRLLNTLLNLCKSANMRVYLQYEIEEAGLDLARLQQQAEGDGLEYDDLKKEIWEWKMRYIDADLKVDAEGSAVTEFNYDQHFGRNYDSSMNPLQIMNVPHTGNNTVLPYWKTAAQKQETRALHEDQVNIKDLGPLHQTANLQTPTSISSTAPALTNSNNVTDSRIPGPGSSENNGRAKDRQPPSEIRSRAASLTNTRPSTTIDDAKSSANGKDGFISVKTELWEPYGLVIRPDPFTDARSAENEINNNHNWFLNSSHKKHNHEARSLSEKHAGHFTLRSNISFSSEDENDEVHPINVDSTITMNKDMSRLFYSPKNSGMDSGPLRWFNPGITVPQTAQGAQTKSNAYEDVSMVSSNLSKINNKPKSPPPDYMKLTTPPPDYNDSDDEEHDKHISLRARNLSMPFSLMNSEKDSQQKKSNHDENSFRSKVVPNQTSTMKSNFQRWPAVRRKSFSEYYKQRPRSSSTPSPLQMEPQSPPPLPPPRIIYSNTNPMSTSSFTSGQISEGSQFAQKYHSNKYIRNNESKHAGLRNYGLNEASSASLKETSDHTNPGGLQKAISPSDIKVSSNSHIPSLDTAPVVTKSSPDSHCIGSRTEYAPGIPLVCSPIAKQTCNQNISSKVQSTQHGRSSPQSKSTMIISSIESPEAHTEKTFGTDSKNLMKINNNIKNQDRKIIHETPTVKDINETSVISANSEDQLRNSDDKKDSNHLDKETDTSSSQAATAITITCPTPPTSLSVVNSGISRNVRSKLPSFIARNEQTFNSDTPSQVFNDQVALAHRPLNLESIEKSISNESDISLSTKHTAEKLDKTKLATQITEEDKPQDMMHTRQDSVVSYSSEIGRVLGELDHTLEAHGWQASLKEHVRKPRPPLVAYV
ncbi:formin-like protein 1 [Plakobranchus ocellatus]|uniref:Formin-like protein 1 n=1 Tax=Plakobranchus ocellatus TaxID=259542 RepID=A0AAV3Y5Y7_9GAST|nr:formin-like protein 1 [Plakobranchus ocellatus]